MRVHVSLSSQLPPSPHQGGTRGATRDDGFETLHENFNSRFLGHVITPYREAFHRSRVEPPQTFLRVSSVVTKIDDRGAAFAMC